MVITQLCGRACGNTGSTNEVRGIGQRQWNDIEAEWCSNALEPAVDGVLVEGLGVPELTP